MADDISDAFNDFVFIKQDGAAFTMGNILVNGTRYWGKWTLNDQADFELTSVGSMDDKSYFNVLRAFEEFYDTHWMSPDDAALDVFTDKEGCNGFFWYIWGNSKSYVCIGSNFFRVLGSRGDTFTSIFHGFILPRYIASGTIYSGSVEAHTIGSNGDTRDSAFSYQFTAYTNPAENTWTELYSNFSEGRYSVIYRVFNMDTYGIVFEKKLQSQAWPQ